MYEQIIKRFEDKIEIEEPFNSMAFRLALQELNELDSYLTFLLGEPGSGKTFLSNYFVNQRDDALFIKAPLSLNDIKNLDDKYKIVIIDEVQLLNEEIVEYIRILADERVKKFILSTHLKDGEKILQKEHFKSRDIKVIRLFLLDKVEIKHFINSELIKFNISHIISNRDYNQIFKYTKGNFRYVKKFMKTLFILLEFAHNNQITKYNKINSCLLEMTAMEIGLSK